MKEPQSEKHERDFNERQKDAIGKITEAAEVQLAEEEKLFETPGRAIVHVPDHIIGDLGYRPALLDFFKDHLVVHAQHYWHHQAMEYAIEGPRGFPHWPGVPIQHVILDITLNEDGTWEHIITKKEDHDAEQLQKAKDAGGKSELAEPGADTDKGGDAASGASLSEGRLAED